MLLVLRRRALHLPVLFGLTSCGIAGVSAHALYTGSASVHLVSAAAGLALGGFGIWLSRKHCVLLSARDGRLTCAGLFRSRALDRDACAFGVRFTPGSRSPSFTVYVSDGSLSCDVGDWWSERSARASLSRLEKALLRAQPADAKVARRRKRVQATIEREERDSLGQ